MINSDGPRLVDTGTHLVAIGHGRPVGTLGYQVQESGVGLVFPLELDAASADVPGKLIRAAIQMFQAAGCTFAQLVLPLTEASLAAPFEQAGFEWLDEAIALRWPAEGGETDQDRPVSWGDPVGTVTTLTGPDGEPIQEIACDPESDLEGVGELIERINTGSLDCPELEAIRRPGQALEGHRESSRAGMAGWWRYEKNGVPFGLALTVFVGLDKTVELLFFGITPEFRGRGIGTYLVRRMISRVEVGRILFRVGVASRNRYARTCYSLCGLQEERRVGVWIHRLERLE